MTQARILHSMPFTRNEVKLLLSGEPFFNRLLQLIQQSKQVVYLQFYILDLDVTGNKVLNELVNAALRGVKVFVVVDGYASEQLKATLLEQYRKKGVYIKRFSPIHAGNFFRLGRRMHHKIVWVDGEVALVGGINLADKYSGFQGKEPWLDFAVELKGPIIQHVKKICDDVLSKRIARSVLSKWQVKPQSAHTSIKSRIIQNDWLRGKVEISRAYRTAIRKSNQSIIIVASYFLPGARMLRLIKQAASRGVNVTVVLGGYSDVAFIKPAMVYLYDWMFRHNITIYEWNKSILHGKLAVVDEKWVTVGSYNMNALSDYGSLELNVEAINETFATEVQQQIQILINEGCTQVSPTNYFRSKNWLLQFYRWVSYNIIRASLLLTFYLMQKARNARTYYH